MGRAEVRRVQRELGVHRAQGKKGSRERVREVPPQEAAVPEELSTLRRRGFLIATSDDPMGDEMAIRQGRASFLRPR